MRTVGWLLSEPKRKILMAHHIPWLDVEIAVRLHRYVISLVRAGAGYHLEESTLNFCPAAPLVVGSCRHTCYPSSASSEVCT